MKTLTIAILICLLLLTALAQSSLSIERVRISVQHSFPNAKVDIRQLKERSGDYYIGVEVYDLNSPEKRRGKEILENPKSYLLVCDSNLVVKQTFKLEGIRFFDRFELVAIDDDYDVDSDNTNDLVIIGAEVMHVKKIWVYLRDKDKFKLIFEDECINGLDFFINENNEKYIVKYHRKYWEFGTEPLPKGEEYDKVYYVWNGEEFVKK